MGGSDPVDVGGKSLLTSEVTETFVTLTADASILSPIVAILAHFC